MNVAGFTLDEPRSATPTNGHLARPYSNRYRSRRRAQETLDRVDQTVQDFACAILETLAVRCLHCHGSSIMGTRTWNCQHPPRDSAISVTWE